MRRKARQETTCFIQRRSVIEKDRLTHKKESLDSLIHSGAIFGLSCFLNSSFVIVYDSLQKEHHCLKFINIFIKQVKKEIHWTLYLFFFYLVLFLFLNEGLFYPRTSYNFFKLPSQISYFVFTTVYPSFKNYECTNHKIKKGFRNEISTIKSL